ncbi:MULTISPECIES: hypothetical protein [Chryseobacterium]|uniref:hypothetical protein n=1 Tax=Chryseobacterium TaxID=59732 RepID=UPI0027D8E13A|nr:MULTISPECIES: hypothetical protein [Chryseobacterium]
MENKDIRICDLLVRISGEALPDYSIVDFWEADLTAIGIQTGGKLVYISTYTSNEPCQYTVIIEESDTGRVLEKINECPYDCLIDIMKNF